MPTQLRQNGVNQVFVGKVGRKPQAKTKNNRFKHMKKFHCALLHETVSTDVVIMNGVIGGRGHTAR